MAKNVLIVDDSSTMRKIVTRALRQAGLGVDTILEAGDGLETLEILGREKVDIILSGINMPTMDGLEFLRKKAETAGIKDIPVVMITTEAGADMLIEVKKLGAVGSIKKPFSAKQVQEVLGGLF